ncbi:DUF2510 domain-containing protein [Aestuariimicrobium sp. T2.26MG-19.2B]|uniref:DUF2510 domain-containing protein n=1 Tax=Aestuariimicrobium sp. T2.26MG-19.2B TaxID=3040679 RepID=UPI00247743BB|nr:DUF2510 domain-containing protein [Aestuariimicrobium sp. T2.26MG-19.2B]CAI9400002.1 hypothetical protein AESSP_00304 [Aestuariimicrobium sp. T2.26MG-19.2B]
MAQPGWYPDPSGRPGHLRWWDGSAWAGDTVPSRGTPNRGGQGPTRTTPGGPPQGRPPRGWAWFLLVGVVVVGVSLALVVRGWSRSDRVEEDTNSSTPTISQWDETSTPTAEPSRPDGSDGTQRTCPVVLEANQSGVAAGRLTGGGISYVPVEGWTVTTRPSVDWADDQAGQTVPVFKSWIAGITIGQVDTADFSDDPRTAAARILSCEASSQYYPGYRGHTVLSQQAITVDGRSGWRLRGEVRDDYYPEVKGDTLDIIVLDVGRPGKLAFFRGMAPIDRPEFQQPVDLAATTIRVVG